MTDHDKNEKLKQAVVIRYDKDQDMAPRVTAKGRGYVADHIISLGKQHSVPLYQNKTLTSMLMAIEIDKEIPPELYSAIAEVLAYIYRLDQGLSKK